MVQQNETLLRLLQETSTPGKSKPERGRLREGSKGQTAKEKADEENDRCGLAHRLREWKEAAATSRLVLDSTRSFHSSLDAMH